MLGYSENSDFSINSLNSVETHCFGSSCIKIHIMSKVSSSKNQILKEVIENHFFQNLILKVLCL